MPSSTKQRMVAGAADLVSRRGAHATSLRDVVDHTDTPRGSLAHHFPGGKQQMLEDVLSYARDSVAVPLEALLHSHGAVHGLRHFIDWWRRVLVLSDFDAGCPILAVAIEQGGRSVAGDPIAPADELRSQVHAAFQRWQSILAARFMEEGLTQERAYRIAALAVAAVEGTVAMCRVARDTEALDAVQLELEALLEAAFSS